MGIGDFDNCGGVLPGDTVDVKNYRKPQGPKGIDNPRSVGLHGTNHGNINGPDSSHRPGGSPGLGGKVHSSGTQGKH